MCSTPCGKRCGICSACTVGVVLVAGLVLVFGAGPHLAQHIMDETALTLYNSTLVTPSISATSGILTTRMNIHLPGPLGVEIQPYDATLSVPGASFGYFEFPKVKLSPGDNEVFFSKPFTITNITAITSLAVNLLIDPSVPLTISGKPTVASWILRETPSQHDALTCEGLVGARQKAGGLLGDDPISVSMRCQQGAPPQHSYAAVVLAAAKGVFASPDDRGPLEGDGGVVLV